LESRKSFGLETTLSGTTRTKLIQQAKSLGYQIELHYLWLPSPELAIRRIAQRVKARGHIPEADVCRRFARSRANVLQSRKPSADVLPSRNDVGMSLTLVADTSTHQAS
jgi:predicted ABC-type ATPase